MLVTLVNPSTAPFSHPTASPPPATYTHAPPQQVGVPVLVEQGGGGAGGARKHLDVRGHHRGAWREGGRRGGERRCERGCLCHVHMSELWPLQDCGQSSTAPHQPPPQIGRPTAPAHPYPHTPLTPTPRLTPSHGATPPHLPPHTPPAPGPVVQRATRAASTSAAGAWPPAPLHTPERRRGAGGGVGGVKGGKHGMCAGA